MKEEPPRFRSFRLRERSTESVLDGLIEEHENSFEALEAKAKTRAERERATMSEPPPVLLAVEISTLSRDELERRAVRAELTAELRKNLLREFVRQLAVQHLPIYPLREVLEQVRANAVSNFHRLEWKQDGLDVDKISAELWRTEEWILLNALKALGHPPHSKDP